MAIWFGCIARHGARRDHCPFNLLHFQWHFAAFSMEIDQAFAAAILTVIGYSINDTVVVFDRIESTLVCMDPRKAMKS